MFCRSCDEGYITVAPGISRKTLTYGEHTLFTEFRLEANQILPSHSHPQEQTGYLVSGSIRLTIGNDVFDASPGDSWNIPCDVVHGAIILEDSVAIEVFSPIRKDYIQPESKK